MLWTIFGCRSASSPPDASKSDGGGENAGSETLDVGSRRGKGAAGVTAPYRELCKVLASPGVLDYQFLRCEETYPLPDI